MNISAKYPDLDKVCAASLCESSPTPTIDELISYFLTYVCNEYTEPQPPITLAELFWKKFCYEEGFLIGIFSSYTKALEVFIVIADLHAHGQILPVYKLNGKNTPYHITSGIIRSSPDSEWSEVGYLFKEGQWEDDKAFTQWKINNTLLHHATTAYSDIF